MRAEPATKQPCKPRQCRYCFRNFASHFSLRRHLASCKAKKKPQAPVDRGPLPPVPCLRCGALFASAREMGIHQTREHFTAQDYLERSQKAVR